MSNVQNKNTMPSKLEDVVTFPITIKFMLDSVDYASSETRFLNEVVFSYHGKTRTVRFFGLKETENNLRDLLLGRHLLLGFDLDKNAIRSFYYEEMEDIKYNIISEHNIPVHLFVHNNWLELLLTTFTAHEYELENKKESNSKIDEEVDNQLQNQENLSTSKDTEENEFDFKMDDLKCLNAKSAKKIADEVKQKSIKKAQIEKLLTEINEKILEKANLGQTELYFNCFGLEYELILKLKLCLNKLNYSVSINCINEDVNHYQIRIEW